MKSLRLAAAVLATALPCLCAAPLRPNILVIFTDDQGYADLGCYGNTRNRTPRLDRLAREGTRFTDFYAQTVCGPSRSALLTGRYPYLSKGWGMPAHETTFAELIREVGYQTACIGKWDVSNRKAIADRMPNAQGFDYYFGTLGANDNGTVHFHQNNERAGSTKDMGSLTRLYTDKAIDYLANRRDPDRPFVLYLCHTMMHTIIDASPAFRGNSAGGLYGDVVEEFDHETGRLLDELDDLGLRENTLVIYTTDNGPWNQDKYTKRKKGHPEGAVFWGDAGPLRNGKGSCYEGGYRVPCIVRWPGRVPAGRISNAIFATIDFMPTFAALAGFAVPEDRLIDGIDQTALLLGETDHGRESFHYNNAGIRVGRWKYLAPDAHFHRYAVDDNRPVEAELYDLSTDIGETTNLADKHPEILADLQRRLETLTARPRQLAVPGFIDAGPRLAGDVTLELGQVYAPEVSPEVAGKDLRITTTFRSDAPDGVVIAQGGKLVGYTLFLRDGHVVFGVRVKGQVREITVDDTVTGKETVVEATLGKNGRRALTVNGKTVSAPGPALAPQPALGLSVGQDQKDDITTYRDERFRGTIKTLVLSIR